MIGNYEELIHEISGKIDIATEEFTDLIESGDLDEQEEEALQELNDFFKNLADSNRNINQETIEEDVNQYMADALYVLAGFKCHYLQTPDTLAKYDTLREHVEFLKHKDDIKIVIINLALALSFFPITLPAYFITAAAIKSWAAFYNPENPVKKLHSALHSELAEYERLIYLSAVATAPTRPL